MNNIQLKKLVYILLGCIILGIIFSLVNRASWNNTPVECGELLFKNIDFNKVVRIDVASKKKTITIQHYKSIWIIKNINYPADFAFISKSLLALKDLKAIQVIDVDKSHLSRFSLCDIDEKAKNAIKIDLYDNKNEKLTSLMLGKFHYKNTHSSITRSQPNGRYIRLNNVKNKVFLVSSLFDKIAPISTVWMKKEFISFQNPKTISYITNNSSDKWTLTRKSIKSQFDIVNKKKDNKIDIPILNEFVGNLFSPMFIDIKHKSQMSNKGKVENLITFENFDGFTYKIKLLKIDNKYYKKYDIDIKSLKVDKFKNNSSELTKLKVKLKKESFFTKWYYEIYKKNVKVWNVVK